MSMAKLVLLAVGCALLAPAGARAEAPPRVYVADFGQNGYEGPAGQALADALARALANTRQFAVERIASRANDEQALERATRGRSGPAWLVEGGIRGLRAVGGSSVGLSGLGFGRGLWSRPALGPGNLSRGSTFALDGWLRVVDVSTGRQLGERRFSSWSLGLRPDYWNRPGGVLEQQIDDSVNDPRTGARRAVLGLLSGRSASQTD